MRSLMKTMAASAALALAATSTVAAAGITRTYTFSATDFPRDAPTDVVSGTLEVTYGTNNSVVIDDFAINIPIDSEVEATYVEGFGGFQLLQVGGIASGVNAISSNSNDVDLAIYHSLSATPQGGLDYSSVNWEQGFYASTVTITTSGAVPEPAAWALIISGIGAIGGVLRHSRRVQGVQA